MAVREIILHIGMHKTGTTAIQRNLDGYDDGRVACADLKIAGNMTPNHGVAIETLYRAQFEKTPYHVNLGRNKRQIAGFRAGFAAKLDAALALDRDKLILSGEAIPRLRYAEVTALRDDLLGVADKVTVVAYIREPFSFCASMFQQGCRSGQYRAADKLAPPGYRRKFRKFIKVFGRKNVIFRPYDRAEMVGGSSVDDFCNLVGITPPPPKPAANIGLSDAATKMLYVLGRAPGFQCADPLRTRATSVLVAKLSKAVTGPAFHIPQVILTPFLDPADTAWMRKKTGFALTPVKADEPTHATDLDDWMRQIDLQAVDQLRTLLRTEGVPIPTNADVAGMMLALFKKLAQDAQRGAWRRRLADMWRSRTA